MGLHEIFEQPDLTNKIQKIAGTSLVGVCKTLSSRDECTNVNQAFFESGCVPYHASQYKEALTQSDISLLDRCLSRVKNDRRCRGKGFYIGQMRKFFWPQHVIIKEEHVIKSIFDMIPNYENYKKLIDQGQSDLIRLVFTHEQIYQGQLINFEIRFDIDIRIDTEDFSIEFKLKDTTNEELLHSKMYTFEEMRTFVENLLTQSFVDVNVIDENFSEKVAIPVIRLQGSLPGQMVVISNYIDQEKFVLLSLKKE